MTYVIYHKETTRLKGKAYKTHAAAKAQLTRMSKTWFRERYTPLYPDVDRSEDPLFQYGIAEVTVFYREIEKTVTRVNAMTGQPFEESANTPFATSPASENYWCS